jgi:hypothetical protein
MAAEGLAGQGLLAIGHLAACTCPSKENKLAIEAKPSLWISTFQFKISNFKGQIAISPAPG